MKPVVPPAHWLLGHYPSFKNDPIRFILDSARDYGDFQQFKLLNKKIIFVNTPEAVKQVMQTNYKTYVKSPGYHQLRHMSGMGIFTSDGEQWINQRKMYHPAFTNDAIKSYFDLITQETNEMLESWKQSINKNETINVSQSMMKVTMSVITQSMFSQKIPYDSSIWNALTTCLEWVNNRSLRNPFIFPPKFPTAENRAFWKARAELDNLVYSVISGRKAGENKDDLLQRFMNPPEGIKKFSKEELRDELLTIFIAGHETTANVMMWTFYSLLRHKEALTKAANEAKTVSAQFTFEDLRKLPYITNVLQEVMRLYPPVWHIGRVNTEEDEFFGHKIPVGTHVRIIPLALHRSERLWENPNTFNPDRFTNITEDLTYQLIPFGAGPRLCAGRNFAMMEMMIILVNILQQIDLSDFTVNDNEMLPSTTLRTKFDVLIKRKI